VTGLAGMGALYLLMEARSRRTAAKFSDATAHAP